MFLLILVLAAQPFNVHEYTRPLHNSMAECEAAAAVEMQARPLIKGWVCVQRSE